MTYNNTIFKQQHQHMDTISMYHKQYWKQPEVRNRKAVLMSMKIQKEVNRQRENALKG